MSIAAQLRAMDEGALVRALPELGTLVVSGPERQSWLSGLVTANIAPLGVGQGCYALTVNKTGRIQSEVWVLIAEEEILLGVPAHLTEKLRELMDGYLIMEDCELAISPTRYAWWLAHGPRSTMVSAAAKTVGARVAQARLGEIETAIVAVPEGAHPNVGELLTQAEGTLLATPEGWDRIRIERMLPRFGVDFDVDCYPHEACLEHLAVSFNKGCYLGQEAVFMLEKRGHVSRRLVRLVVDGEPPPAGTAIHTPDGKEVGAVTSGVGDDGKAWLIGMVRYKQTLDGTELRVGDRTATVSCLSSREGASCH